jgi:hypothetical protein
VTSAATITTVPLCVSCGGKGGREGRMHIQPPAAIQTHSRRSADVRGALIKRLVGSRHSLSNGWFVSDTRYQTTGWFPTL